MNPLIAAVSVIHRILDNLPLVVPIARQDRDAIVYQGGYHVGVKGQYAGVSLCAQLTVLVLTVYRSPFFVWVQLSYLKIYMLQSKDEKFFIHNHLTFLVKYHKDETTELSRIVGFEVKPFRFVLNYSCHILFV